MAHTLDDMAVENSRDPARHMAVYECFDSFAAFEAYLRDSGPELEPSACMLVSEYSQYSLDRA